MKRALQLAQILQHGMTAHREGRLAEAERSYQAVLDVKRDDFDSLHLLGVVRWQQRRHDEASQLIKQALRDLSRHAEALASFERALALRPRNQEIRYNRANCLQSLGRLEEALRDYDAVLAANPNAAEAHNNRGFVLEKLRRFEQALASFEAALALRPVFLDTLPYNAHSTAIDALRTGLPVVTCPGRSFAGRVGASLLHAVGLPELIARDLDAYQAMATKLARDPPVLESIRHKLAENKKSCALFGLERLCRHVEAAYATMWDAHLRGESPRGFRVEAD